MTQEDLSSSKAAQTRRERLILIILAAVQFTTIVDFMIVMPLGPQLMEELHINPKQFALIISSYTFAAGVVGLLASSIVDRFARRPAFMAMNAGFLLGTLLCAFAPGYGTLVLARIVTGAFGGILGGMAMTIIGDVFPEERRGRATGSLMTGFALASVAGVPLGLYLGTEYGWQIPFIALVIGGLPALLLTPFAMPRLGDHVHRAQTHPVRALAETFTRPNHLNAFALIITLMIGGFSVFPYVSTYYVQNVGMTVDQLPLIYVVGGGLTLLASPFFGRFADRFGKLLVYRIVAPFSAALLFVITHLPPVPATIAIAVFGALMVSNVGRMIAAMAMVTGSVEPSRRGAFLSANSSVQHVASGIGAYIGGSIITEGAEHRLENFGQVGWIAAGATLLSIWLAGRIRPASIAPVSAQQISLAAAAEASVDAGETLLSAASER